LLSAGAKIHAGRVVLLVKANNDLETQRVSIAPAKQVDRNSETLSPSKSRAVFPSSEPPEIVSSTDRTITGMVGIEFIGQLVVEQGADLLGRSFPIEARTMLLGRGDECDIQILDAEVSRAQAELVYELGKSAIVQRSGTKSTKVNGTTISDQQRLRNGDIITLADRVQLRIELHEGETAIREPAPRRAVSGRSAGATDSESEAESLKRVMEQKLRLDQTIEDQYSVNGSFLDVDVVDSYGMKVGSASPEQTIVSFERFREFVGDLVITCGGQVLNSNGDELMCFFDSPLDATKAASALLAELTTFNSEKNLLSAPFRVRIGIHTGQSLVDLERGVAYSEILDVAGHLQKKAETNHVVVSQETLDALPEGSPFKYSGEIDSGVSYHTMLSPLE
jgi:class 3 adenylate cyclase